MNILLLNGGKDFGHSHGELNHTLHKKAKEVLTELGHNVKETVIDAGYNVPAINTSSMYFFTIQGSCIHQLGICQITASIHKNFSISASTL